MTPEGRVKAKIKAVIKKFAPKAHQFWPVQNGFGAPTLDCLGTANGRSFAIEAKAPGKKPSKLQEQTIAEMRAAGCEVFVIDGRPEQLVELEEWLSMACYPQR